MAEEFSGRSSPASACRFPPTTQNMVRDQNRQMDIDGFLIGTVSTHAIQSTLDPLTTRQAMAPRGGLCSHVVERSGGM